MKILQTIKYYDPCKGGMEAVAKNLVDGTIKDNKEIKFTVYCNNHKSRFGSVKEKFSKQLDVVRESTPIFLKSQPLTLFYKNLRTLIKKNDVIHHHYPFPTMELALMQNLNHFKDKKFVITWHANIQNSRWSWIEKLYNPLITKLLDRADHIVVTSPQLFEESVILKKYADKVKTIPLTFNPKFIAQKAKTLPSSNKKILFVGKFREYKGLPYLIEAMHKIDAHLDVVGSGEKEKELKEQVAFLGLENKITFWTNASDDDLMQFYKEAHLFILPSINEAEAFGVVQLEALGAGVPVINTRLKSGVPYVSLDGITGLTVTPGNSDELAEAANKILSNPSFYEELSANALDRSRDFVVEKMVSKYLQLYQFQHATADEPNFV